MNVLVLGGTRYFGRRLVDVLLERGHAVTVASRRAASARFSGAPTRVQVARDDAASMRQQLGGKRFDVVVDQICMRAHEASLAIDTFRGTVGRYVMTSTMSVYAPQERPLNEDAYSAENAHLADSGVDYAEGKRCAEAIFARSAPFPTTRVRVPIVLGEDDPTGRLARHVAAVLRSERIAFHEPCAPVSMISSASIAAFLAWVVETEVTGAINAASEHPVSGLDVLETAADFSPYSSPTSIVVDTARARGLGYSFDSVTSWLPELIHLTATRVARTIQPPTAG
jgi:nucleoside-diphosphate-sugar epimerase